MKPTLNCNVNVCMFELVIHFLDFPLKRRVTWFSLREQPAVSVWFALCSMVSAAEVRRKGICSIVSFTAHLITHIYRRGVLEQLFIYKLYDAGVRGSLLCC